LNVVLSSKAVKYLKTLNEPAKSRIKRALQKLEVEPPQGGIISLSGRNGFRLRVGDYRVLFGIVENVIAVEEIALRDKAYRR